MRVLIGNDRPDFEAIHRPAVANCANIFCQCGEILQSRAAVYHHWAAGHFDKPVYREFNEENLTSSLKEYLLETLNFMQRIVLIIQEKEKYWAEDCENLERRIGDLKQLVANLKKEGS
ncbi:MAG: hypothetical protein WC329_04335 [Candidatus Omnitrophota bacterium]|jgi:hypothetical protein